MTDSFIKLIQEVNNKNSFSDIDNTVKGSTLSFNDYFTESKNYQYNESDFPNIKQDSYAKILSLVVGVYFYLNIKENNNNNNIINITEHKVSLSIALYYAAHDENDEAFDFIKKYQEAYVNTALYYAACDKNDEAFDFIKKDQEADVNTALYYAAHDENDEAFDFIKKDQEADVNTALYYAAHDENDEAFDFIKKYQEADVNTALYYAAQLKNHKAFDFLKDKEADVNEALYIAAQGKNDTAFDFLKDKEADVNEALYIAAQGKNDTAFDFIKDKEADVNEALYIAAQGKNDTAFDFIKDKEADVDKALKIAINRSNTTSINFFIQKYGVNYVAYTAAKMESSDLLSYIEKCYEESYNFNDLVKHISKGLEEDDKKQEAYKAIKFISDRKESQRNKDAFIAGVCAVVTVALVASAIILPLQTFFVVSASMSLVVLASAFILVIPAVIFGDEAYQHHQQLNNIPDKIKTKVNLEESKALKNLASLCL